VLLVVFGAGASFDSVPHLPPYKRPIIASQNNWSPPPVIPQPGPHEDDRPPLANQLFDGRESFEKVVEEFPACNPLIPQLRSPAISVENELARIQEHSYPAREVQLAAIRYYLHTALWRCEQAWRTRHHGITNYGTFIDEIERWRSEFHEQVCFVTFNYDTMLEKTIDPVLNASYSDLDAYISRSNYAVIKLHGSVNWGRVIEDGPAAMVRNPSTYTAQRLVQERGKLRISDRFLVVDECPMLRQDGNFVFPAISIPVENKDEFECPQTHVERLKKLVPNVDRIVTIGWRAMEDKFLSLLANGLPRRALPVMVVSGSFPDAEQTHKNLARGVDQVAQLQWIVPPILIESGFSGLITREREKLNQFLRAKFQ
jgi:hypothetical protein